MNALPGAGPAGSGAPNEQRHGPETRAALVGWPAVAAATDETARRNRARGADLDSGMPRVEPPGTGRSWTGAPGWLREVANTPLPPTYQVEALPWWQDRSVVLLNDVRVELTRQGTFRFTQRYAVWSSRGGWDVASKVYYFPLPIFEPRRLRMWLLQRDGSVLTFESNSDMALAWEALESRADIHVWGLEITGQAHPQFAQFEWFIQELRRVRLARVSLSVPDNWLVTWRLAGLGGGYPVRERSAYSWQFHDLPSVPWDRHSGYRPISSLGPRLAIDVHPPAGSGRSRPFGDWGAASRWLSVAHQRATSPAAATTAKARSLVSGLATEEQRMHAVIAFVRSLGAGGPGEAGEGDDGQWEIRPRPAARVLERGGGNCQDRAALAIALLAAIGIESAPMAVRAEDEYPIRRDWPSLQQFNHEIVAIRTGAFRQASSAVLVPGLGRRLLVDPGARDTPIGDVSPWVTGPGLIGTPAGNELIALPRAHDG